MSAPVDITWWGHATTTIEMAGTRVLTDPLFSQRLAHLRRVGGPPPAPAARHADVVVISHLHRDHLHVPSLTQLPVDTVVIAPRGTAAALRRTAPELSRRITEADVGQQFEVGRVRITAVPAAHDGSRGPGSRFGGVALGYLITGAEPDAPRTWFAGDTGLFDGMADLGPIDIGVLPIGGWGPTLGPEHLDPSQAAEAAGRVDAGHVVPIHFGTFWPVGLRQLHPGSFRRCFTEPGPRFVSELQKMTNAQPHLLAPGDTASITVAPR